MVNKYMIDAEHVVAQLKQGQLFDFAGGVYPPQQKTLSNTTPINTIAEPQYLFIPIKQHIGTQGSICVKVGQHVSKGQALTQSTNPFAVPVHASTSGVIKAVTPHPSAHPSGIPEMTVTLEPDGHASWQLMPLLTDYTDLDQITLLERICQAGISGLGGAGFPTHLKSNPQKPVECLIINGIECEPYISSDDRIMREHAWQIKQGIDILRHIVQPKQIIIAIEDNKPQAMDAIKTACLEDNGITIASVPTKYPSGGEKQLIQILTGNEVPEAGLPIDIGCLMYNVGTCFAIADAVLHGKALVQRVVTLTGQALQQPQNVWALLGTPISHLLTVAQYDSAKQDSQKVIMGGPMMGFTVVNDSVPVVKITNCLLVPDKQELPDISDERACIRCGLCADACPAGLLPQQLFWHSKAKEYDKAQAYNLDACIECGACAYVCPSEIPLVHYYRKAKTDIKHIELEKEKSEKARVRFETRQERLLADKLAREEKHRLAAEARKKSMDNKGNDAKDKIAAALARAKAKRAAAQNNTSTDSDK